MKSWLDIARLVLASLVVIDHIVILFFLPNDIAHARAWFPWLNALSAGAVGGFFLISGFAIAHSTARPGRFSLRRFTANRLARIYPPLFAAIGIAICLRYFIVPIDILISYDVTQAGSGGPAHFMALGTIQPIWISVVETLSMMHGPFAGGAEAWALIAPAWTLPLEMLMYAVAGISMRLFRIDHPLGWAAGASVWCGLWLTSLWLEAPLVWILLGLWAFGFLVGLLTRWNLGLALLGVLAAGVFASGYAYAQWQANDQTILPPYGAGWTMTVGMALFAFTIVFTLGGICRGLANILGIDASLQVPDFSYSLYICHFPLLLGAGHIMMAYPWFRSLPVELVLPALLLMCMLVCWFIGIFVEQKKAFALPLKLAMGLTQSAKSLEAGS